MLMCLQATFDWQCSMGGVCAEKNPSGLRFEQPVR
jgi:hypothetical protein